MSDRIVIRGGRVLDPGAGLDEMLDVLVADGLVARIEPDIEPDGARVFDAKREAP